MLHSRRFLVSILMGFSLFSAILSSSQAHAVVIEKLEASVNSSIILLSDVVKFRETLKLRAQLDPLFAGTKVSVDGPKAETKDIVDFLVDEKLISQLFPATDSEVEQEINTIQSNNHIDRAGLKRALGEQGFSFEQYFELIRISLSKRNLIDRDIRTKVTISDDDVKNYFYNHYAKTSAIPMAYKLEIITVALKNYKNAAAAKDVADNAFKAIKGGESFEDVAKRASDDSSASSGGDLGTLAEDQMSPIIRTHATKMQVGQVSDVFGGTETGSYMILKLADVQSSDSERYEKMKDEIRNQLFSAETQHQITLWLERQRQDAFIHHAGDAAIGSNAPAPEHAPGAPITQSPVANPSPTSTTPPPPAVPAPAAPSIPAPSPLPTAPAVEKPAAVNPAPSSTPEPTQKDTSPAPVPPPPAPVTSPSADPLAPAGTYK